MAEPRNTYAAETLAVVRCVECSRPREAGELWHLYFSDIGEACAYCPECAEREFGSDLTVQ